MLRKGRLGVRKVDTHVWDRSQRSERAIGTFSAVITYFSPECWGCLLRVAGSVDRIATLIELHT